MGASKYPTETSSDQLFAIFVPSTRMKPWGASRENLSAGELPVGAAGELLEVEDAVLGEALDHLRGEALELDEALLHAHLALGLPGQPDRVSLPG